MHQDLIAANYGYGRVVQRTGRAQELPDQDPAAGDAAEATNHDTAIYPTDQATERTDKDLVAGILDHDRKPS